mmetsp:Transcript_28074/g.97154  ORF Transcript_28074/g.97154 Transcript_28074/m.97154 type:complete len:488 (-) Transcript_28074:3944-5407(-)
MLAVEAHGQIRGEDRLHRGRRLHVRGTHAVLRNEVHIVPAVVAHALKERESVDACGRHRDVAMREVRMRRVGPAIEDLLRRRWRNVAGNLRADGHPVHDARFVEANHERCRLVRHVLKRREARPHVRWRHVLASPKREAGQFRLNVRRRLSVVLGEVRDAVVGVVLEARHWHVLSQERDRHERAARGENGVDVGNGQTPITLIGQRRLGLQCRTLDFSLRHRVRGGVPKRPVHVAAFVEHEREVHARIPQRRERLVLRNRGRRSVLQGREEHGSDDWLHVGRVRCVTHGNVAVIVRHRLKARHRHRHDLVFVCDDPGSNRHRDCTARPDARHHFACRRLGPRILRHHHDEELARLVHFDPDVNNEVRLRAGNGVAVDELRRRRVRKRPKRHGDGRRLHIRDRLRVLRHDVHDVVLLVCETAELCGDNLGRIDNHTISAGGKRRTVAVEAGEHFLRRRCRRSCHHDGVEDATRLVELDVEKRRAVDQV